MLRVPVMDAVGIRLLQAFCHGAAFAGPTLNAMDHAFGIPACAHRSEAEGAHAWGSRGRGTK